MAKADNTPAPPAPPPLDFERAMGELETLVDRMEHGDFSLEDSIAQFERGMALASACQKALGEAEQKVSRLTSQGDQESLQAFALPDES